MERRSRKAGGMSRVFARLVANESLTIDDQARPRITRASSLTLNDWRRVTAGSPGSEASSPVRRWTARTWQGNGMAKVSTLDRDGREPPAARGLPRAVVFNPVAQTTTGE